MIKDSSHSIPVEMYNGFEAHGVKIVLEVKFSYALVISISQSISLSFSLSLSLSLSPPQATIPSLTTEPTASELAALPHLYEVAQQILNAGTRLIYTYTHTPTDIYLYEEAIL